MQQQPDFFFDNGNLKKQRTKPKYKENTHVILEKGHGIQEGQAWVRDGEKAMAKFVEIFLRTWLPIY